MGRTTDMTKAKRAEQAAQMDMLLKKVKDMEAMIKKQAKKMKTQKRVLENWYRAVETVVDGHNRHVESIQQLQEKVFPKALNDPAVHQLAEEYLDELYDVKKEWEAGLEEDEEDEEDEDKEFEEDKAEEKGE
jgi:hypothetical protein